MGRFIPNIKVQYLDGNGDPYAGGKVYSYYAGTTTPLPTYSDDEVTPNTNPVILDADGRADIWLDDDFYYKIRLLDSNDVLIWEVDNIPGAAAALSTVVEPWQLFNITDGQAATDLTAIIADGVVDNSVTYDYEIIRGTTVVSNGYLALQYVNSTWEVNDGGWTGSAAHGVTWSVTQVADICQLRAATSSGPGAGTIRLRKRFAQLSSPDALGALTTDDLTEGATNFYFTDERAQDAVGSALTDTASIDFTYTDGSDQITADVLPAGVDHDALLNAVGLTNDHAAIDTHIADSTIHFTEGSIDHTAITNIGTNTHAQIDTHIASTSNPHTVTMDQVETASSINFDVPKMILLNM